MPRTVLALAALAALAACNDKKAPPAPALTRDVIENGPVAERVPELITMPHPGVSTIRVDRWHEVHWNPDGCAHTEEIGAAFDASRTEISGQILGEGTEQTLAARITADDHFTLELRGPIYMTAEMVAQTGIITGEAPIVAFTRDGKICEGSKVRIDIY